MPTSDASHLSVLPGTTSLPDSPKLLPEAFPGTPLGRRGLWGLKVCFVAGTLGQGGAERQLFYMVQALKRNAASVRVLCLDRDEFWEGRIRELGVPVTWVGRSQTKIGRLLRIVADLRRTRPSIVQSQHFYTNSYAACAGWMLHTASVGALRSNGAMEREDCGRVGGWLNLRTPRVLAANSQAALHYASRQGRALRSLFLLRSVVDTTRLSPGSPRPAGPLRLLAVGRLVPAKRFDRFLSVLARLREDLKQEVTGILVGAGPLRKELERKAAKLNLLPSGVEFRGAVSDVASLYGTADILAVTSEYEGTPNVVLEAMASGLPVVATRVGGVPEVVRHGHTGLLVEPEDREGMHECLKRLCTNGHLRIRMGKEARVLVEARHSLDCLPRMLDDLYRQALSPNLDEGCSFQPSLFPADKKSSFLNS